MLTAVELIQKVIGDHVPAGVQVVSKVPMRRPELFVRVEQGAPRRINPLQDQVRVIVQVYGVDLEQVIELISSIREALINVSALHTHAFGWEEDLGPYEFPDPDISDERWQLSGVLYMEAT